MVYSMDEPAMTRPPQGENMQRVLCYACMELCAMMLFVDVSQWLNDFDSFKYWCRGVRPPLNKKVFHVQRPGGLKR